MKFETRNSRSPIPEYQGRFRLSQLVQDWIQHRHTAARGL